VSWWWWLGLAAAIGAILFVVGSILFVIGGIAAAFWQHRREEARRVTIRLEGFGDFTSTNDKYWSGEVDGKPVSIETDGGPPLSEQLEALRNLLNDLPRLTDVARAHLIAAGDSEGCLRDVDAPGEFGFFSLHVKDALHFTVDMEHPDDPNGWYYVVFEDGVPLWSGRDD